MMTRERFAETNYKMSYEEYKKCCCSECDKEDCIHRDAYRRFEWRVMKMYKLQIYKLFGLDKGNLDHEEFFDTKEQMDKRYDELFQRDLYGLNPTAWEQIDNEWKRLEGY